MTTKLTFIITTQLSLLNLCQTNFKGFDRKNPPPPGGFPIYYVPSSRTVCKRTPLEAPGTNSSREVLLLTVLGFLLIRFAST